MEKLKNLLLERQNNTNNINNNSDILVISEMEDKNYSEHALSLMEKVGNFCYE